MQSSTFHLLVVVIFSMCLCSGCISIETNGTSSRTTKNAIVKTGVYKTSKILYPISNVGDIAVRYPEVGKRQMSTIGRPLAKTTNGLIKWHNEHRQSLSASVGENLPEIGRVRIRMANAGKPTAFMDEDQVINIDIKVAQGFFLGSLVTGLEEDNFFGRGRPTHEQTPTDLDLLKEFLELRDEIDATRGRTLLGDILSDGFMDMDEFAQTMSRLNNKYQGTFLFLLAHEIGHIALSHFQDDVVDSIKEIELAADRYAVHLLVGILQPLLVQESFLGAFANNSSSKNLIGYIDLFQYGYERVGFRSNSVGLEEYPSIEERFASANSVYQTALREAEIISDRGWQEVNRKLEEAMAKALGKAGQIREAE